jgi:hypothetical protein
MFLRQTYQVKFKFDLCRLYYKRHMEDLLVCYYWRFIIMLLKG